MVAFELAIQDGAGVDVAVRTGADRIELCSALALGGLTPSAGLIERAVGAGVPVHVLIRPRAGDFDFDADGRRMIVRDVRWACDAGAAGVVVGGTRGGRIDADLVRAVVAEAEDREVTFHRALDVVADPSGALIELAQLGVRRVLTSGGADRAADGRAGLTRLVRAAAGAIEVMAGGGVTRANVASVMATGVDAIHASAKALRAGAGLALGSAGDAAREVTDEDEAATLRRLVGRAGARP
ncbi:copper homeostasis protein CutC [Microbacterium oleivorans]|uniref:PF03932 family protein CutC n=1 Tax=Microbacterium oleivorans TaxID=273677 RepID=A0A7D5ITK5_9MICO|nr:copper homeostasis protein CutC [Microbacterium oleivorans]QLD12417.1 copper homeostasis protein CutC [Microbacterium oleivorans]